MKFLSNLKLIVAIGFSFTLFSNQACQDTDPSSGYSSHNNLCEYFDIQIEDRISHLNEDNWLYKIISSSSIDIPLYKIELYRSDINGQFSYGIFYNNIEDFPNQNESMLSALSLIKYYDCTGNEICKQGEGRTACFLNNGDYEEFTVMNVYYFTE